MGTKFDKFYLENDKIYPIDVYWNLYDKDRVKALKKYKRHMYCPNCKKALLIPVQTKKTRYFKAIRKDMHEATCFGRYGAVTKRTRGKYHANLTIEDIQIHIENCLDKLLEFKNIEEESTVKKEIGQKGGNRKDFNAKLKKRKEKDISDKNFNIGNLEGALEQEKFFYGKCSLSIKEHLSGEERKVKRYYLKVLNPKTKEQIFDIWIPQYAYKYMKEKLRGIPKEPSVIDNYCLCIYTVMRKRKGYYNCKLEDSREIKLM